MFVDAAVTSKLVEQALPLMPFLDDGNEFMTYDYLVERKDQFAKTGKGPKPDDPDNWTARISGPLLPKIADVVHEQVYAALSTVAFHDRNDSPWGQATLDLQEWLFLPDSVSGLEHKPSDSAAVSILLATLYGDRGHLFLAAANRYLVRPSSEE
ncbi:hypothetical protein OH787_40400 (plasmid) [Streptomyces sp. NBC_01547]|uniref:hypothetical protein n=1 Tax=Streptomyces TaxID=1883 RepID=UPI000F558B6B|nr:hypothetical protein [Streptomyces sp. ADI91-18]RPK23522.1 hypothetical protein EES37_37845 [Streptomyces sp. ADI91-18]WST51244.1 hypothetical protein OG592_44270 [Streptomyces avidinii]